MKRNLPTLILACLILTVTTFGQVAVEKPTQRPLYSHIVAEASANEEGTEAVISWEHYNCVKHITYDDGSMENMFIWGAAGGRNAVRFTPYFYPANLVSGKVFIGEGHFPQNFEVIGSKFVVEVYDDDGANGMPGTLLESKEITVKNYYWVSFGDLQVPIQEGDFYIAIHQLNNAPESIAIGIDEEHPVEYRSYSKDPNGEWEISIFHDFMIRAVVSGDYNEQGKHTHLDEITYNVAEYTGFDPLAQNDTGTQTILQTNLTNQMAFVQGLTPGYRKYGVQAVYDDTVTSPFFLTDILSTGENAAVVFEVSTNDGSSSENALLELKYLDYPFKRYEFVVPASGLINDTLWKGAYRIRASLEGYEKFEIDSVFIEEGDTIYIELQKIVHPVCNLQIDTTTSLLSWNIHCDPPNPNIEDITGYRIYLDGELLTLCDDTSYVFPYLFYGQAYTATVEVDYGYGVSDPVSVNFTSGYLPAPLNVSSDNIELLLKIEWDPPIVPPSNPTLKPDELYAQGFNKDSLKFFQMSFENYNIIYGAPYIFNAEIECGDFTRNMNKGVFFIVWDSGNNYLMNYKPGADTITYVNNLYNYAGHFKAMACDRMENKNYLCYIVDNSPQLAFLEPPSPSLCFVGTIPDIQKITALAFAQDQGMLVGFEPDEDKVYLIEKNTGGASLLGDLGFDAHEDQSASWNPVDQQIYLAAYDNVIQQSGLYIIDRITGNGSLVAPMEGKTTVFAFECIDNYGTPLGLLNYKIYESGELVDTVDAEDTIYYYEPWVPTWYQLGISAQYDLAFYGYPGETAESEIIWADSLYFYAACIIPLNETWDFGFEGNDWLVECDDNWMIDLEVGNSEPSAAFRGDSTKYDYSCELSSWFYVDDGLFDGGVCMTYDLKLDDPSNSGTEHLNIWIHYVDSIELLKSYSNMGSFDWQYDSIDLTSVAKGETFSIIFEATGEHSSGINAWFIDNIHIYHYCPEFEFIHAISNPEEDVIELSWSPPPLSQQIYGYDIYQSINNSGFVEIESLWPDTSYIVSAEDSLAHADYCFYVECIDENCGAQSDTVCVAHPSLIDELKHEKAVQIYPNPAKDHIYLNTEVQISKLDIFSAMGKKEMATGELPAGNHRIELAGLRNGVYLISVETEENQYVFKLLINK